MGDEIQRVRSQCDIGDSHDKLMLKWYSHVMGYDTTDFLHCTFQFTFKLTNKNEQWAEYSRTKQVSLDEFVTKNKDSSKICKFKAQAPVIINRMYIRGNVFEGKYR
jgi:hypothetical protein